MFENITSLPADPILGLMAAYRQDSNPHKIDLGVGVYKDEHGRTPVMRAVKACHLSDARWLRRTSAGSGIYPEDTPRRQNHGQRPDLGQSHPLAG